MSGRGRRWRRRASAVTLTLGLVASLLSVVAIELTAAPAGALDNPSAVRVAGSNGWRAASVGAGQEQDNGFPHVCTILTTGKVRCSGHGSHGETGNGVLDPVVPYPVEVSLQGSGAVANVDSSTGPQIASYERSSCAIVDENGVDGGVQCWGRNDEGQLGDGSTAQRTSPVRVLRDDYQVPSFSLGDVSPRTSVNTNFAVRYTKHFTTSSAVGSFIVNFGADDFSRVYLTNVTDSGPRTLIGDRWGGGCCTSGPTTSQSLAAGKTYRIELEMRDTGGNANVSFSANTPSSPLWDTSTSWKAEWFNATDSNATNGTPVRTDPEGVTQTLRGATAIAGNAFNDGAAHFCAVANGGLFCWGRNDSGELGDGTNTDRNRAVATMPETNVAANKVTSVAAGPGFTCAVINGGPSGTAKCWGDNDDAQLGTVGTANSTDYTTPAFVKADASNNLTGISQITAAGWHACGLMNDKTVRCWGKNDRGQIGNNVASGTDIVFPTTVRGLGNVGNLTDVRSLTSAQSHNCATVGSAGDVYCWGFNANGQLGDGTQTQRTTPVRTVDAGQGSGSTNFLTDVSTAPGAISAGTSMTCFVKVDGTMACTGKNDHGQLGDGTTTQRLAPVWVNGAGPDLWSAAAVGGGIVNEGTGSHSCVVTTANQVKCWGWGGFGQIGVNSTNGFNPAPRQVTLSSAAGANPVASKSVTSGSPIASSNASTCVIFNSATVTGGVQCWGRNNNGELGDGTTTQRLTPVPVLKGAGPGSTYLSGVTAIGIWQSDGTGTGQPAHTCAVANGGVYCWGYNKSGELGNGAALGNTGANPLPVQAIPQGSGVVGISVGNANTCAVFAGGGSNLKCWGYNAYGQLGIGDTATRNVPTTTFAGNVASVSLGTFHQCLVNTSNQVWCVGRNRDGSLGIGNTSDQLGYQRVVGVGGSGFLPSTATTVASGLDGACAVAGGEVYCWGNDANGKLGRGTNGSNSSTPVKVLALGQVAGSGTTMSGASTDAHGVIGQNSQGNCVRLASGGVNCWGRDVDGELGAGTLFSNHTTISGSAAPAPNAAGWHNSNVTVSWTCNTRSPATISICPPAQVLSTEGTGLSASGTTVDSSGFDATATVSDIKLDKTAPTGSGSLQGTPTNGWYTGDVTVDWTCNDSLSGVKTCPADSTITGEGSSLTVTADAVDNADNSGTLTSPTAKIDRTKPSTSISAIPTWSLSDVTVTLTPTDNLSGVASTSYSVDGGPTQSGTSIPITSEGVHTVEYSSTDEAGNVEDTQTATVRIDKTAPTISASTSPAPNAGGWNNSDVEVTFTCSDGTSGVLSCAPPATVTDDTAGQLVAGAAFDVAGNSSNTSVTVKVDKTAPTIDASATPAPNAAGWNNSDVTVSYSCSDATSGIVSCPSPTTISTEGTGLSASGTAFDAADNSTDASVTGIKLDKTDPTISGTATTAPNANGWYAGPVTIHWTCDDELSGVVSCPDDEVVSGNGLVSAQRNIVDAAGNEAVGTVSVFIDTERPTISGAPTTPAEPGGYHTGPVTIHWTCDDPSSGSGVATCPLDETITEAGPHTVTRTATDVAGNESLPGEVTVMIAYPPTTPGFGSEATPITVKYDEPLTLDVRAGSTGSGVSVQSFTQGAHGDVTTALAGDLVYTPTGHDLGADTFSYTLVDTVGQTVDGEVHLVVVEPDPPTAGEGGVGSTGTPEAPLTTPYMTPLVVPALAASDGFEIEVSDVTQAAHGTVAIDSETGDPVYTPEALYAGADSFDYTVTDSFGQSDTATAHVFVGLSAAPTAPDYDQTVQAPGELSVAAPGVLDGATGAGITITDHTEPAHGDLTFNSSTGAYTYTPDVAFTGADSFTYTVADAFARSATGTVNLTVNPPDAPTATDLMRTTAYFTELDEPAPGVLAGASGTMLSVTDNTDPLHGTVTVDPDGSFVYQPDELFAGPDSFTVTISDPYGQSAVATVNITVGMPSAATVEGHSITITYQTPKFESAPGLLTGSTGAGVTVTSYTQPAHGALVVFPDGGYQYSPEPGYLGPDSFAYTATDAFGRDATATVLVEVVAAETNTVLVSSPNPSEYSEEVLLTATVNTPVGSASGTVSFYRGATLIGTATVVSGVANLTTTGLPVGELTLTASFTPSGTSHSASTSDPVTHVVDPAATDTVLASTPNPSAFGQSVTFTATVTGPGGTPTGTVTFTEGSTTLATVAVDGTGEARYTTSTLSAGDHSIEATFTPSGPDHLTSTSDVLTQVVNPGAPGRLVINKYNQAGIESATISWTPPTTDGGSPITGYLASAFIPGGKSPVATHLFPGDVTTGVFPGLTNGTAYVFEVQAVNAGGTGPRSAQTAVATVGTPKMPIILAVAHSDASAHISWTAAAENAAPVTAYRVNLLIGGVVTGTRMFPGDVLSGTVTGLTNGQTYVFEVAGINAFGVGYDSVRSSGQPIGAPGMPKAINGKYLGGGAASLTWDAPAPNGTSPITGYVVTAFQSNGSTVVKTVSVGDVRSGTVTGLNPGTYILKVQAVNAVGPSFVSAGKTVKVT